MWYEKESPSFYPIKRKYSLKHGPACTYPEEKCAIDVMWRPICAKDIKKFVRSTLF